MSRLTRHGSILPFVFLTKPGLNAGRSMLLIGDLNHGPDTGEYNLWIEAGWGIHSPNGDQATAPRSNPPFPSGVAIRWCPLGRLRTRLFDARPMFTGAFRLNISDNEAFA